MPEAAEYPIGPHSHAELKSCRLRWTDVDMQVWKIGDDIVCATAVMCMYSARYVSCFILLPPHGLRPNGKGAVAQSPQPRAMRRHALDRFTHRSERPERPPINPKRQFLAARLPPPRTRPSVNLRRTQHFSAARYEARLIRTCTRPRPLDGVGGRLRRLRWCGHLIADLGVVWLDLDDLLPEVLTDEVLDLIDRAERNILRECLAERRKINANVPAAVVGFRGCLPRTDRRALRAAWRQSTRMRQPRH